MADIVPQNLNDLVLEIRFSPNPKILDYRGTWAEASSKHMGLSEWQIQENRFDIYDKELTRRFFVSYRNAGVSIRESTTRNYFADQANKFLRFLFDQSAFGNNLFVERFGVRGTFATIFKGPFEELLKLYTTRFLTLQPGVQEIINAKIVDVGGPIDFSTGKYNINMKSGPMGKDQLGKILTREGVLPEVSLFFDFDYWVRPKANLTDKEILLNSKTFSGDIWDMNDKLCSLILG